MGRFARSWNLFKVSMKVAVKDRRLLWLPIISLVATIIAVLGVAGVLEVAGVFAMLAGGGESTQVLGIAVLFLFYLVLAVVQVFFYGAMVAGAKERLAGGRPTVGNALKAAWGHAGRLFAWAVVVAVVNVLLTLIRAAAQRAMGNAGGAIVGSIAGMAWNLATYFVVPVLMFEDRSIGGSIKHSAGMFKRNWGESVVGEVGFGLVALVLFIPVAVVGFLFLMLLAPLGIAGVAAAVALIVMMGLVVWSLVEFAQAVYKTALYRYAATGAIDAPFRNEGLEHAFRPAPAPSKGYTGG